MYCKCILVSWSRASVTVLIEALCIVNWFEDDEGERAAKVLIEALCIVNANTKKAK